MESYESVKDFAASLGLVPGQKQLVAICN